ncbi:MAG: hypothetical protein AAFX06_25050 [Planctomycetota bacterium]
MNRIALALALACFSLGLYADEAVKAPSVNKRDRPITIQHPEGAKVQAIFANVVEGRVVWQFLPDEHFTREAKKTVFAAPPGEYLITTGDSTILKIVDEGGPKPRPPPPPPFDEDDGEQDDTEPEPAPKKLKLNWVVWVEEQANRSQNWEQTATMIDPYAGKFIADWPAKKRIYDADQAGAKPFLAITEGKRPAVVLMESDDRFLVFPAPKSVNELETLIRRHALR